MTLHGIKSRQDICEANFTINHKIILSRGKSHQLSNQVKVREPASFEILNELAGRISRISILHIVVSQNNNGTTLIIVLLEYKLIYLFE